MRQLFIILVLLLSAAAHPSAFAEKATVERVVDGDTLWLQLNGKSVKARLICTDSLEKKPNRKLYADAARLLESKEAMMAGGVQAADYLKSLVRPGDAVRIEYGKERFDRYGRLLVFLYSSAGADINLALIRGGYAGVLCYAPNDARAPEFLRALSAARSKRIGLWGKGLILQERWVQ